MRDVTRGPAPTEHDARPLGKRPDQLLHYDDLRVPRPPVAGINVQCRLKHFAIISYTVDPALLRPMIPQRFRLDTIMIDGREQALVSAVPFLNVDFGLAAHPSPRLEMPQVDYRAYIIDEHTGERAVWFFGTTLDSWSLPLPRYVWQQPWHAGRTRFDCRLGGGGEHYEHYHMHTASAWGSAEVTLRQPPELPPASYPGVPIASGMSACRFTRQSWSTHVSRCSTGWAWSAWLASNSRTAYWFNPSTISPSICRQPLWNKEPSHANRHGSPYPGQD